MEVNKKEYIESIVFSFMKPMFPRLDKLEYRSYDKPHFRKWEAVYIEILPESEGMPYESISIPVTNKELSEIVKVIYKAISEVAKEKSPDTAATVTSDKA